MHFFAASTSTASRKLKRRRKDHQATVSRDVRCLSQDHRIWITDPRGKDERGRNHENASTMINKGKARRRNILFVWLASWRGQGARQERRKRHTEEIRRIISKEKRRCERRTSQSENNKQDSGYSCKIHFTMLFPRCIARSCFLECKSHALAGDWTSRAWKLGMGNVMKCALCNSQKNAVDSAGSIGSIGFIGLVGLIGSIGSIGSIGFNWFNWFSRFSRFNRNLNPLLSLLNLEAFLDGLQLTQYRFRH